MKKEKIEKEDGRYLIFYSFEESLSAQENSASPEDKSQTPIIQNQPAESND